MSNVCETCQHFGGQDYGFGWCTSGRPVITARQFSCGNWEERPAQPLTLDLGCKEDLLMGYYGAKTERGEEIATTEVVPLYRHGG